MRLLRRHARAQRPDVRDQQRRELDGIHALRHQRRMRLLAAHAAAVFALALVRDHRAHRGRFADDAASGPDTVGLQVAQQAAHANAADLLVVRQRQVEAGMPLGRHEVGHSRQRHRDEALHVGRAPPVQAAVADLRIERVALPRLAVDRHHVGMARQHQPRPAPRRQRGKQIGLAAGGIVGQAARGALGAQAVAHPLDQAEVGVAADGIERHQRADQLQDCVRRLQGSGDGVGGHGASSGRSGDTRQTAAARSP